MAEGESVAGARAGAASVMAAVPAVATAAVVAVEAEMVVGMVVEKAVAIVVGRVGGGAGVRLQWWGRRRHCWRGA